MNKKQFAANKKTDCAVIWQYDDASGQVADCRKKTVVKPRSMTKERYREFKKSNTGAKKRRIQSGIYQNQSRLDLMNGISVELSELKKGFRSLSQLLEDYALTGNMNEITQLFSLVLLGYTAELFLKYESYPTLFCSRAPVILVEKHRNDFTGGFEHLSNIIQCLAIDTSLGGKLRHHNPAVLPDVFFSERIDECAYMRVKGDKTKTKFPAQYRDTAVLLHKDFFKDADVEKFVHRNPWASVFLFNMKKVDADIAALKLNMNRMDLTKKNWETIYSIKEKIQIRELMVYFTYWLSEINMRGNIAMRVNYWIRFGIYAVQKYNYARIKTQAKVAQGSEKRYLWLQVASLRLFLDFCFEEEIIDENVQEEMWNKWCNALIPGSRDAESYQLGEEKRLQAEENERNNVFALYEKLLKMFIETASDDMFGYRKQYAKTLNIDAYYRDRPSILFGEYGKKEKFGCLLILKEDLIQFSKETNNDFREIIDKMWSKDYATVEYRPYIHTNNNFTLRREASPYGVVLNAEKMAFLKPDVHKKILKLIEEAKVTNQ